MGLTFSFRHMRYVNLAAGFISFVGTTASLTAMLWWGPYIGAAMFAATLLLTLLTGRAMKDCHHPRYESEWEARSADFGDLWDFLGV